MVAQGIERIAKRVEVGQGGAKHLVTVVLAQLVGVADQVAEQRGITLGIWQFIAVEVADHADDAAGQLGFAQVEATLECAGVVVGVERPQQVGIAVGHKAPHATQPVIPAEAAVGAATYADLLPQIGRAQVVRDNCQRAATLHAQRRQTAALGDIIDLRRDDQRLVRCGNAARPGRLMSARGWQPGQRRVDFGTNLRPDLGISGDVAAHRRAVDQRGAHLLQHSAHAVPIALDLPHKRA